MHVQMVFQVGHTCLKLFTGGPRMSKHLFRWPMHVERIFKVAHAEEISPRLATTVQSHMLSGRRVNAHYNSAGSAALSDLLERPIGGWESRSGH